MTTSIFSGIAPPNVTTTGSTTTAAPGQYLGYLSALGTAGTEALNPNQTLQGNINAGQPLVAPLNDLQNSIYGTPAGIANTQLLLNQGLSPLTAGSQTAATSAKGIGADQINNFLNPYITDVNKNLETATQQNINQSILPSLQALGASTGQTGSSRLLNATGQTLGAIQQGLGAQESTNLASGYQNAVTDALQNQQNMTSAAQTQGNIGTGLLNATVSDLNTASALGAQGQAQTQAMINAPLSNATNVAGLLRGYTIPTTTNTTSTGPANSYGASPLSQIAGLATLFGSTGTNGVSPVQGIMNTFGLTGKNDPNQALSNLNSGVTSTGTSVPSNLSNLGGYGGVAGNQVTTNENGDYVDKNTGQTLSFFE
jgi:hypothetical protein